MGIHYTYGANRGAKKMEKQAKKEKKLAERRAKKQAKSGMSEKTEKENTIPLDTVITLDHLTNPDKKQKIMFKRKKASKLDLKNALRKNLRKRKLFQKKKNQSNDTKR